MKTIKFIFGLASLMFLMSACSPRLTPFTQRIYDDNGWTEADLQKIQFYLSDNITLFRDVVEGSSKIEGGKVRQVKGRKVEEIVIPEGTPGVLVFSPKDDRFAISFEDGNDERFLMFGPNPKARNKYLLLAKEWKKRKGEVTYEGRTFYTNAESAYAALMIDIKKIRKTKVKRRTADGRKL